MYMSLNACRCIYDRNVFKIKKNDKISCNFSALIIYIIEGEYNGFPIDLTFSQKIIDPNITAYFNPKCGRNQWKP